MVSPRRLSLAILPAFALLFTLARTEAQAPSGAPGETQILKWKDGKKACFLLAFDDSAPSQLKNVIPELEKRKMVGTFYLVTGNSLYANLKSKWEAAAKSPSVVVANHTFTHKGVEFPEQLDPELVKNNEVLYALHPEKKQPYLLAFGKPGGVPWIVPKDIFQEELTKNHLVDRPPFAGPPLNYKTPEATNAVVDQAIAKGEMGHFDFHGVGGDWLVTSVEWFNGILDKLEANRDNLWITDAASWHKYVKERETAEAKGAATSKDEIHVTLTSKMDPTLYDQPLTLSTRVPADWKNCVVTQGSTKSTATVKDGTVQYDAVPGQDVVLHAEKGK